MDRRLRRALLSLCLVLLAVFVCSTLFVPASAAAEGIRRALVMGFDNFLSQASTTPSSQNNVDLVAQALSGGTMNLARLVTHKDDIATAEAFEQAVQEAFFDAEEGDISYFYISTHGVWEESQSNGAFCLLLSDGGTEASLTALELRRIFDRVSGTKVLLIDACRSGAMLGKGVSSPWENVFQGEDYKVLCSSGGAEESWFWSGHRERETAFGAGYFSGALTAAITSAGNYGADVNSDGAVTLTEMKAYLLENHGTSSVQSYPEEDGFVLFTYDAASYTGRQRDTAVKGISFDAMVLSAEDPVIDFSFTVVRPVQVIYQLVYYGTDSWEFDKAKFVYDNAERFGGYGDQPGMLSPGYKERSLSLGDVAADDYGYVLLQLLTREEDALTVQSSRVVCVPPEDGDPLLEVLIANSFTPAVGQEFSILIHHQYPCELSVWVEDASGQTVRRLISRQSTRPQGLRPLGTTLCWNGKTGSGEIASPGLYRLRVCAYIGSDVYELYSEAFQLAEPQG